MTTNASQELTTAAQSRVHDAANAQRIRATYSNLMRYKRWADEQLFTALLARPNVEAEPQTGFIRQIVGHFHAVDCIFQAHLQGLPHAFKTTSLEGDPSMLQLKERVSAVDQWYVDYAQQVDSDSLAEALSIRFTDGAQRVLSRAAVLLHISHHGAYHRGNAGVLMKMMGMDLPPDRFFNYIDERLGESATHT